MNVNATFHSHSSISFHYSQQIQQIMMWKKIKTNFIILLKKEQPIEK